MNTRIRGILMALFIVPALFSSPGNKAVSFETVSRTIIRGVLATIKNCLARERLTAITCGSARLLWNVAKVTAVGTVLANICMPTSLKKKLVGTRLGRFVFAQEKKDRAPGSSIPAMPQFSGTPV